MSRAPSVAKRRRRGGRSRRLAAASGRARARRPEPCRKGCAGMAVDLGKVGIWSRELRFNPDRGARTAAAAELEELGYLAIFIPDVGGDVLGAVAELLAATRRVPFATGILNIWMHHPV